jgi:hypothetical protein
MKYTKATSTEAKRQARKKASAEDFTPSWLANEMLDKLTQYSPKELWEDNKTFLDPAIGNGNLILPVLQRKLNNNHNFIQVLNTLYGCDIMQDNISECRLRLLKTIVNHCKKTNYKMKKKEAIEIIKILARNIVCTPLTRYPNGSLDYLSLSESETFNKNLSDEQAEQILNKIIKNKLLDKVTI